MERVHGQKRTYEGNRTKELRRALMYCTNDHSHRVIVGEMGSCLEATDLSTGREGVQTAAKNVQIKGRSRMRRPTSLRSFCYGAKGGTRATPRVKTRDPGS